MEGKNKAFLIYFFIIIFCLNSCINKSEENYNSEFKDYNLDNYDNVVLYEYKRGKLIRKVEKYSVKVKDASISISEYEYNEFDSLAKVTQITNSKILGVIDSTAHFYQYSGDNKLSLEYRIDAEGDTNLIEKITYLPNYQDSFDVVKRKVLKRNTYSENDVSVDKYDIVEIYYLNNLIKMFNIDYNQDTSIYEYNQFNEKNNLKFNYALGTQGDTIRVRRYNYKSNKLDSVTGYIEGVEKKFTEYYDENSRIKKIVAINHKRDTVKYYYNYNEEGFLEVMYWKNN